MRVLNSTATVFDTTDLDVATTVLNEQYTSMRVTARGPHHGLRIVHQDLGRIQLDRINIQMNVDVTAEPLGVLAIGRMLDGHVSYRQGHDEWAYRRGDVFLSLQPDAPSGASLRDFDVDFAFIPPDLLGEIAQTPPGTPGPVRLLDHRPISPADAAQWTRTYALVKQMLAAVPLPMTNSLVTGLAERLLVSATLDAFPNTALVEPTIEDRHDAHPDTVRRAIAFIEASPGLDLTSADIASAACVTIRAVQLAFRRHLGMTPMAYLRRVRLNRAHRDLLAADPYADTVNAIAARWGFLDAGRFATAHRSTYGQSPSHALGS